jgi:predicted TIM-barrel fold metal-dependent hydrolase
MQSGNFSVDSHAHIFTAKLPLAKDHRHAPQYDATLPDYLHLLDTHGISHGVLTAPSFLGMDNSFLLDGIAQANGRLRGTVIVDPGIGRLALEELDRKGIVGIRLNFFRRSDLDVPELRSATWRALFSLCAELAWHVEIYGEGPRLATWLPQILETGVKVVVDHFGSPDPVSRVDCAGFRCILSRFDTGRLWVKLSAPYRVGAEMARTYAAALLREGGSRRLVWGSD